MSSSGLIRTLCGCSSGRGHWRCRNGVWLPAASTGRPRGTGIKDYDLIYHDAADISWAAEDAVIRRVAFATEGCVGPVEARNQARVHLWFASRFGSTYPALSAADESLRYYAAIVHAVG